MYSFFQIIIMKPQCIWIFLIWELKYLFSYIKNHKLWGLIFNTFHEFQSIV